jgi:hypothetical protein
MHAARLLRRALPAQLALLLAALPAAGAEWQAKVRAAQEVGFTDNVALRAEDEEASPVSVTSGEAELTGRNARTELTLGTGADLVRYPDAGRYDSANQLVRARVLRLGQRSRLTLAGSLRHDDAATDPEERSRPEASPDQRRLTFELAPGLVHQLTRRDELELAAGWTRRHFPGGSGGNASYVDYDLWSLDAGLVRAWTRQLSAGLSLYGSYFESARQRTRVLGPLFSLRHRRDARQVVRVAAGPTLYAVESQARDASGRRTGDSDRQLGFTVRAGLDHDLTPTLRLELSALKGLEPSGDNGEVVDTSRLDARLVQELTRALRLELAGVLLRETGVDGATSDDRTYVELEPGLAWMFARDAELSLRYRYRRELFDAEDAAIAHGVSVRVGYNFPVMRGTW